MSHLPPVTIFHLLGFPGLYISAGPSDVVTLRGLILKGDPATIIGVQIGAGHALYVEDCVFSGMGLGIAATAGQTIVRNTTIKNSVTGLDAIAIVAGSPVRVTVDGSAFEGNNTGVVVRDNASMAVTRSTFADNDGGILTIPGSGMSATAHIDHCLIANNGNGLFANSSGGTSTIRLSNSTVTGNSTGVQVNNATLFSLGNNMIYGNLMDGDNLVTLSPAR